MLFNLFIRKPLGNLFNAGSVSNFVKLKSNGRNISKTISFSISKRSMSTSQKLNVVKVFDSIVKPAVDQRAYRGIELENGIKLLLISDPKSDKSAASIDVHIGSLSDPIPGLAHFCEHMLFLGSKKFPTENTFAKYIEEHGGSSNAYTANENTNYHFDIATANLKEALDIFSQFFISPLFDPNSTDREINAVNSENNKNLQSDVWRIDQFEKNLCKPTHAYSKFGTGNTATLKTEPEKQGINIRDELIKFHAKHYSSNIMSGCILGVESLDTLQEYAVDMFSAVPNKTVSKIDFEVNPFMKDSFNKIHYLVPVQDIHQLNILFQLPDYRDHYESNPTHYISHLVGHEGPGSLLSELKARGWCNALISGARLGARGFQFFTITFDLSEDGMNHVPEVVELCYQYLNLLRKEGVKKWIHDELVDIGKMKFRFKDKDTPIHYVSALSSDLHKYKMEHLLTADFYSTKYEPQIVEEILNIMKPEQMISIAISKKYEGSTDKVEKWYGTQYRSEQVSKEQMEKWQNCGLNEVFKLPEPNSFIPTDFTLIQHPDGVTKLPEVIKQTPLMRIWYKGDDKFLLPKATFKFELRNPMSNLSPKYCNMTELVIELLIDSLSEYTYSADLAGLRYRIDQTNYGIQFSFNGFDNKLDILVEKVIKRLATFKIDEKRFNVLRESYKRNLQNFQTKQPYQHAMYYMLLLTAEKGWTKEELLETLDGLTVKDLQEYIPKLLTNGVFIESVMFGNVSKEKTIKIVDIVENYLQNAATANSTSLVSLSQSQLHNLRHVQLPNLCDLVYVYNNNIHQTIGIEAYYQCEEHSTNNNILVELFCQIINESTYNVLRTQEQLGYIVASGVRRFNGMQGVRFIIQSDKEPTHLDERVENFILQTSETLKNMTEEEFKTHVDALKVMKLEEPKTISKQCETYWNEISSHEYKFDRENIEVEHLNTIKKSDIIAFYEKLISPSAPNRKKLVVYVHPSSLNDGINEKIKNKKIENLPTFKAHLPLCPLPKPYIKL